MSHSLSGVIVNADHVANLEVAGQLIFGEVVCLVGDDIVEGDVWSTVDVERQHPPHRHRRPRRC